MLGYTNSVQFLKKLNFSYQVKLYLLYWSTSQRSFQAAVSKSSQSSLAKIHIVSLSHLGLWVTYELTDRKRKNRAKPTTIPPTASSSRQAFINIWVSVLVQSLPNNILNESVGLSSFQLHEYVGGIVKQSPSLQSLISTNHLSNLNQALPRI